MRRDAEPLAASNWNSAVFRSGNASNNGGSHDPICDERGPTEMQSHPTCSSVKSHQPRFLLSDDEEPSLSLEIILGMLNGARMTPQAVRDARSWPLMRKTLVGMLGLVAVHLGDGK